MVAIEFSRAIAVIVTEIYYMYNEYNYNIHLFLYHNCCFDQLRIFTVFDK